MDFRAGSSPVARTKNKGETKVSPLFLIKEEQDLNPSKCNADERCRRRLDRAEPLFCSLKEQNANQVLSPVPYRVFITDLTVADTRFFFYAAPQNCAANFYNAFFYKI